MSANSHIKGHFIGGELVTETAATDNINPSDITDVVGRYAQGDAATAATALDAAHDAFGSWSTSPIQQRFDVLDAVGSRKALTSWHDSSPGRRASARSCAPPSC